MTKSEYAGLSIEMPKENIQTIEKFFDYHVNKMPPQEKLNFLEKTLLKRKSLIIVNGVAKKRQ